jgi:hypothetical protein
MLENMGATSTTCPNDLWWWNALKKETPAHLTFTQKSMCGGGWWEVPSSIHTKDHPTLKEKKDVSSILLYIRENIVKNDKKNVY